MNAMQTRRTISPLPLRYYSRDGSADYQKFIKGAGRVVVTSRMEKLKTILKRIFN